MQPLIFEHPIQVQPAHLDGNDHVNNVVYVQWIQDIATMHWETSALPEHQRDYFWVVLRHEIDYKSPAWANDWITLRTWMNGIDGLKVERRTEIIRTSDQKILVAARTLWCMLDKKTQRPQRVSDAVAAPFVQ